MTVSRVVAIQEELQRAVGIECTSYLHEDVPETAALLYRIAAERIATLEQTIACAEELGPLCCKNCNRTHHRQCAIGLEQERDALRAAAEQVLAHTELEHWSVTYCGRGCQTPCTICGDIIALRRVLGKVDSLPAPRQAHE